MDKSPVLIYVGEATEIYQISESGLSIVEGKIGPPVQYAQGVLLNGTWSIGGVSVGHFEDSRHAS